MPPGQKITGEIVYIYAYDIAYDMMRAPIPTLLGQPVGQYVADISKRSPRHLSFYRPQMVRMPALEIPSSGEIIKLNRITINTI